MNLECLEAVAACSAEVAVMELRVALPVIALRACMIALF